MVEFDQRIPPGEQGRIGLSIKVYPSWAGKNFKKMAVVYTNDPVRNKIFLKLTGAVEPVTGGKPKKGKPKTGSQG